MSQGHSGTDAGELDKNMKTLVTISDECFEAQYIGVENADGRDGVLYRFKLRDLLKDRGQRLVSLFRSGPERVFIKHYDARIEPVRLSVLRRAFDSGSFSFETAIPPNRIHEMPLTATDFRHWKKANDDVLRRFIKFGAYCLGFKCRRTPDRRLFVDFDCPEDLDYLGASSEDISRNVWLLTEKGYLRSSAATPTNPLRVSPTEKLITEIENGDDPRSSPSIGANVTQHFYIHGHNPRVNVSSTDSSVNITTVSSDQLFVQLREATHSIVNEAEREKLLIRLDELEKTQGSSGFSAAYQSFIASAANYMTIFGPFIPALTQMLSGN